MKKSCEVSQYIGNRETLEVLPVSKILSKREPLLRIYSEERLTGFHTGFFESYDELSRDLKRKKFRLAEVAKQENPSWTVIPGSTISLPFDKGFNITKSKDDYYRHIREKHGISAINAENYYSFELDESYDEIIRLSNLLRVEASLILSLTASSPFYDGWVTGNKSERWLRTPKVPDFVPFFSSYESYMYWNERMLVEKHMFNSDELWLSVRPEGKNKPERIDSIQVRISDSMGKTPDILAVVSWLEFRLAYFLENKDLQVESKDSDLIIIASQNEYSAAVQGFAGHFSDWLYEEETSHYDAIYKRLDEGKELIESLGLKEIIMPLEKILSEGNESERKLAQIHDGLSIEEVLREWTLELEQEEL